MALATACGDTADDTPAASGPAPAAIVQTFEQLALATGNPRDNTGSCSYPGDSEGSCVALMTTDHVSVYQWQAAAAAERFATGETCGEPFVRENGGVQCTEVIGSHFLRFGGDIDFPVTDADPYIEAARALIQE